MIVFQGMVGSGKSTLSKLFSEEHNLTLFPEPLEDNPYLNKYYSQPSMYAFPMQVFLVHNRFKHALKAQAMPQCVMDTSMYQNDIYVEVQHIYKYMTDDDYLVYSSLSNTFKNLIKPPDLMVYLRCDPIVAIERILKRGRQAEIKMAMQYWFDLYDANEVWYEEYSDGPKIMIETDIYDIVESLGDRDIVMGKIKEGIDDIRRDQT